MIPHNLNLPYKLEEAYHLQFGSFYFYENFIVGEINTGVNLTKDMAIMIVDLVNEHYDTQSVLGYISHRIHKYTVSSKAWLYFYNSRIKPISYAIVTKRKENVIDKYYKKYFNNIGDRTFDSLFQAASYISYNNILESRKKEKKRNYLPPGSKMSVLL